MSDTIPFKINEKNGRFEIIRTEDGKLVGTSDTREKAERSIKYRIEGGKPQLNSNQFPQVYEDLALDLSKLGCVMLDIDHEFPALPAKLQSILYYTKNEDRFWIDGYVAQDNAHVTLLYGLLHEAQSYKKHIISVLSGWSIEFVTIKDIGFFPSPFKDDPYFCIIAKIEVSPELKDGHQRLQLLPHVDTYPEYKPHITLAYVEATEDAKEKAIAFFQNLVGVRLPVIQDLNLGGNKK